MPAGAVQAAPLFNEGLGAGARQYLFEKFMLYSYKKSTNLPHIIHNKILRDTVNSESYSLLIPLPLYPFTFAHMEA